MQSQFKQYVITAAIQVLVLLLFSLSLFCAFRLEIVALMPLPIIIPMGIIFLCLDILCTILVFRIFSK